MEEQEKVWLPHEAFNDCADTLRPARVYLSHKEAVDTTGRTAVLDNGGNVWYTHKWELKDKDGRWVEVFDHASEFWSWYVKQTSGTEYREQRACIPYHAIQRIVFSSKETKTVSNP